MDDSEIYRVFISKLKNNIDEDAKGHRDWENSVKKGGGARKIRMVNDARFYGGREHATMVHVCNDTISVLAQILNQKSIKFEPKYCPK